MEITKSFYQENTTCVYIKNTHKILKTNTSDSRISWFNVGEYKSRKNMVGDLITTPPKKVKNLSLSRTI